MKNLFLLPFFILFFPGKSAAQTPQIDAPFIYATATASGISITINNPPNSNNYNESFDVWDHSIHTSDSTWDFEGYIIYQLSDCAVLTPFESLRLDTNLAREVAVSDLNDGITTLYNYDSFTNCQPYIAADGTDSGTQYVYTFTTDAFTGQPFTAGAYTYAVIAYAMNYFHPSSSCPSQFSQVLISAVPHYTCISVTGIKEAGNVSTLPVFPSPAHDRVTFDLSDFTGKTNLILRDVSGRQVKEYLLEGGNKAEIGIADLPSGMYFLEAVSEGKTGFGRLIRE